MESDDPDALCIMDPSDVFLIPSEVEASFREALDGLCSVDYTALGMQLADLVVGLTVSVHAKSNEMESAKTFV